MWLYLITFLIFALAIFGMAIGVIFSNRRIQGSCGGLANMKDHAGNPLCSSCTNPSPECTSVEEGQARGVDMPTASTVEISHS